MRHAMIFGVTAGLVFCGLTSGVASAQSDNGSRDRLRSLLERKIPQRAPARPAPRTRSAFPPTTRGAPARQRRAPDEIIVITPGGNIKRAPALPPSDRRSRFETDDGKLAWQEAERFSWRGVWGQMKSLWTPAPAEGEVQRLAAGATGLPGLRGDGRTTRPRHHYRMAETRSSRMRRSTPFGVVPDTYIIQFKYTATNEEIEAVLRKYNLQVVGGLPKLGIIYVEHRKVRTRGLASDPPPASARDVVEPSFLKSLRREPGVNAATVQATIAPKSLPRPSDTTVQDAGKTYSWSWRPDIQDDGNWGIKRMRFPTVWRILDAYRERGSKPVAMGFLDSGFGMHPHIKWRHIFDLKPGERLFAVDSTCAESHGTHVAGIAGASHGLGNGIDGIVPNAVLDAIPLQDDGILQAAREGINNPDNQNFLLFTTALGQLTDYLDSEPVGEGGRRVVNISLGHNWRATLAGSNTPLEEKFQNGDLAAEYDRLHILSLAQILRQSFKRYEKDTVFVVAAGNDSEGLDPPLKAKWSSPFAYLGLESSAAFESAPNVIVVEAADRSGARASFSNGSGHVAAPGVDIMSTIGGRRARYAICEGTSQAAPHVTALAAILMEIAPDKTPGEIVDIIKTSAVAKPEGGVAPRVDALEAVIKTRPEAMMVLADLNNDGVVDADDLATYKRHREAMTSVFMSTLGTYFLDLNGNGQIEDNEHWWPRIDLNGSGLADLKPGDDRPRCLGGKPASDLDVIKRAWQDGNTQEFQVSAADLGLIEPASSRSMSRLSASTGPAAPQQCSW